jgi:hypothetical protein
MAHQLPRPQSVPAVPAHAMIAQGMNAQQPLPGFQHVQQHQLLHQAEQYQNMLATRLQQLQRETQRLQQEMGAAAQGQRPYMPLPNGVQLPPTVPNLQGGPQGLFQLPQLGMRPPNGVPPSVQAFIAQQQRGRAADGRNGAQDSGSTTPVRSSSSGRASPNIHRPDHTSTYTREGIGPNGERWQMTVNETTTTIPLGQTQHHHHHPAPQAPSNPILEVQAIMRSADRAQAARDTRTALDTMQRSASNPNPSLGRFTPNEDSAVGQQASSVPAVTPATITNGLPSSPAFPTQTPTTTTNLNTNPNPESVVYLLSSPQGPRALLLTNSETYYSPRQHRRHRIPSPVQSPGEPGGPVGLPEYRNRPATTRADRVARRRQAAEQLQQGAPHANPGAGALAAQIGPVLWLIVRLVGFVWFLTSGNPSWSRWFMVTGIAFIIFIVNTGFLNGAADQIWGPIRRHLEALIPLAGPDAALVPAANAAVPQPGAPLANENEGRARARNEPDPAETAARLIEQHRRANQPWILTQFRRVEHSLLLFLASLVPGVGERHIAAREAEAAERQRRIDEAAAAAQQEVEGNEQATAEGEVNAEGNAGEGQDGQPENQHRRAADVAPLIEV